MTLKNIAVENLRRRKGRAFFVLIGLLISATTIVILISLVHAMKEDINHKLELYGANILILPKTESLSFSYGGLTLGGVPFYAAEIKEEDINKIKQIKNAANVAAVGPILLGPVVVNGHRLHMAGVDFRLLSILRPWWNIKGEIPPEKGAILGHDVARFLNLTPGDRFLINKQKLEVKGVIEKTGSQDDGLIFVPLPLAQEILGKKGHISMAEVAALCTGCPIPEMVRQIGEAIPGANVMAIEQVVKGRMETLNHFERFSYGISVLVLVIGSLMVLVTMMGSVKERTVEIGILSAMGFRKSHIIKTILLESGMISGMAGIMGYGTGFLATKIIVHFFSGGHGAQVLFNPFFAIGTLLLSLTVGLIASTYPAIMASRLDPNEALRAL
ncbi:MAG: ABC transporter permease [Syntrophorhabdaceae bacterium]|nr:ABC transporter permease [Syntrophorhabdaceae bacterium]